MSGFTRKVVSFWAELPQPYIDSIKKSSSWQSVRTSIQVVVAIHFFLHFMFVFVFDPAAYPELWLMVVDAIQSCVPGAASWGVSSRLLWDQMPSLHALGFLCGIYIFTATAIYSPGMQFFVRCEDGSVTTKSFLHSAIAGFLVISLAIYFLFFFWGGKAGPMQSLEGQAFQLRNLLESKFGNSVGFPVAVDTFWYFMGASVAWVRMVVKYRFARHA